MLREQTNPAGPSLDRIPTAPGEDEDMFDIDERGADGSGNEEIPSVQTMDGFELCRAVKDRGKATTSYEVLDATSPIRGLLSNWEELYVQFRDEDGRYGWV